MDTPAGSEHAIFADILERHLTQIKVDLIAELLPQIVGRASGAIAAAAHWGAGGTTRRAYRLIDREDNIGDAGLAAVVREKITAARTSDALDEAALPQHREELLEVGQRNFLPFGDLGERDGVSAAVLGEIDHCHDGIASLGAQPHGSVLRRPKSNSQPSSLPLPPDVATSRSPAGSAGGASRSTRWVALLSSSARRARRLVTSS